MVLLLLLPWVMGILLADRLLRLQDPVGTLSVGLACGWLLTLMTVNLGLLLGAGLPAAIAFALLLATILAIWLWRSRSGHSGAWWKGGALHRATWAFLVLGAVAVHLTANTILYLNPDDDYYLHSAMQGQMLKGIFPIINPYLPGVMYGGHYAKDLLAVVVARISGATLFEVQAPLTVAMQLAAFGLLFTAIRRAGDSQLQAVLGTACVYIGANAGFRGGWLDTVANNNALAQMVTALCFLLAMEALFVCPGRGATVLAGVVLGGLAWAYETNFAVVALGLCGLAFSTLCLRTLTRAQIKTAGVIVAIALPLAVSQGGVLRNLLVKLSGGQAISAVSGDQTLQSQNLEVSVKFPKEELFQIKLDRSGEEMSMAYSTLPLLRDQTKQSGTPGYVSVFSWYAIRIHWLALYLAPLSLYLLARRRNPIGLLLWWVGAAGYFLPSLVNFGLWESEVFRWEFVAAWGFAGALGVALGHWWEGLPGPVWVADRRRFELRFKGFAAILIAALLALNFYPSYHQARQRFDQLDTLASGLLFPSPEHWFARQPELDLDPADFRAGLWLARNGEKGQRLLTNFRDENEFNVYFESSFVGLCGMQLAGHTFPLPFERLGTRPFRLSAAARAFWDSHDSALLGNFGLDWLYLRGRPSSDLDGMPGLRPAYQEDGEHTVFRVSIPALKDGPAAPGLKLETLSLPAHLDVEQYLSVPMTLANEGSSPLRLDTTLSYDFLDEQGKPVEPWDRFRQPVSLDIPVGGRQVLAIHLVTPHQAGAYRLVARLGPEALPGEVSLAVGARRGVSDLRLLSARPLDPLVPGQVANYRLRLRAGKVPIFPARPVLAALIPTDLASPLYAVRDFSELRLSLPAGGEAEITLPMVVPEVSNGFQLMLLPRDGWGIWPLPPP